MMFVKFFGGSSATITQSRLGKFSIFESSACGVFGLDFVRISFRPRLSSLLSDRNGKAKLPIPFLFDSTSGAFPCHPIWIIDKPRNALGTIPLRAGLALAKMLVAHCRMIVKFRNWFRFMALKTLLIHAAY